MEFYQFKTGLIRVSLGVYGGADYGRVWIDGDNSKRWNNSFRCGLFVNMAKMISANISAFIVTTDYDWLLN